MYKSNFFSSYDPMEMYFYYFKMFQYWTGGHFLRIKFLNEAINSGYRFVTGYAHRDVILQRKKKMELIEIVHKYDPDKLDYYRIDLNNSLYQKIVTDAYEVIC